MRSLVLDTNIVLDLYLFDDEVARPLADELEAGAWHWLATRAMRDELARVLTYPHIAARLAAGARDATAVLAQFDRHVRLVEAPAKAPFTCKDGDDQKFIDLAVAHRATLLSKDAAVLTMRKRLATLQVQVARSTAAALGA